MLGDGNFSGTSGNPAVKVTGDLYRFRKEQLRLMRRRQLPTMAFCGNNPLYDVSGPVSRIEGSDTSRFTYCVAEKEGECQPDSRVGDAYANCPYVSRPYCQYSGVGTANADMRDICLGDNGTYTQAVIQVGVDTPGQNGLDGRILTYALSRYRFTDPFWNAKMTPDGRWLLIRVPWLNGKRAEVLAAQIPPIPESPAGPPEMTVLVAPPEELGVRSVGVEFGYTPEFYCTSRQEACVRGAHSGQEYSFSSLPWNPYPCGSSCEITVPAIPDRVL
jgi:hypothetical protein